MLCVWSTRSNCFGIFKGLFAVSALPHVTEHRIRYLHHPLLSPRPFTPKDYLYTLNCVPLALQRGFLGPHTVPVLLLSLRSSKMALFPTQKCSVRFRKGVDHAHILFIQINPALMRY